MANHSPNEVIAVTSGNTPPKTKKFKKKRLEYKEVTLKDGSTFKGMMKSGIAVTKRKHISGTGEFNCTLDNTVYKGALMKGQPHGFGEKFWPQAE